LPRYPRNGRTGTRIFTDLIDSRAA